MNFRRILLTTDFSPCARSAYGPAGDLARRTGARLDLVHCFRPLAHNAILGIVGDEADATFRRELRDKLELEAKGAGFAPLAPTVSLIDGGGAEDVAALASRMGADLVVQASHGRRGVVRLVLGSFAEALVRSSAVPVLTIKNVPATPFRPRTILFPHDLSPASGALFPVLRSFARVHESRVVLLHVWSAAQDVLPVGWMGIEPHTFFHPVQPEKLARDLDALRERELAGLKSETCLVRGDPASSILDVAASREVDLICMGTHGWRGLDRFLLGSIAEKVLRGASCPVLTVHPRLEAPEAKH
jgi:nucleotide-binding universal stress UspA family protein